MLFQQLYINPKYSLKTPSRDFRIPENVFEVKKKIYKQSLSEIYKSNNSYHFFKISLSKYGKKTRVLFYSNPEKELQRESDDRQVVASDFFMLLIVIVQRLQNHISIFTRISHLQ